MSDRIILNPSELQAGIRLLTKFKTFEPEHRYWLDTGNEMLNGTLGSQSKGLPYGKMYEIRGKNHGGKTCLSTIIAGMAQRDGAGVGYMDIEDSRDRAWAVMLGLNYSQTLKIYPKMISQGKKKPPRLESAEELFEEAETAMALMAAKGFKKQFWFMDSVANLRPRMQVDAGATGGNMRTRLERAQFLSDNLPRWTGLAANYNAMIILINQVRTKQGMVFGSRDYSPGGNAFEHTCQIRADVRRIKNGRLRKGSKTVGLVSLVTNFKNKVGRGSVQDMACAFSVRWDKSPADILFMSREEAEELFKA